MIDAYCGWFDTRFKGSPENPTDFEVGTAQRAAERLCGSDTSVCH